MFGQLDRQFNFGMEFQRIFPLQFVDIDLAKIESRKDRQSNDSPDRMSYKPCQANPIVTIKPLPITGTRSWIMMDVCPLDMSPLSLCRRVIYGEDDQAVKVDPQLCYDGPHQSDCNGICHSPDGCDGFIESIPVIANTGRTQP